ncbi:MAG: hypothetical protein Q9180_007142, partial [Flavoplaca navasiana]
FLAALASPAELEPLWKPFPGQRDVGGCDQDLQNLKDSYSQAIDLCNAALAALDNIQEPKPEDAIEGQKWDRQARLAKAMWNLETDPTTENYRSVTRLVSKPVEDLKDTDTKRVYCTPKFITFVDKGQKTPWGITISVCADDWTTGFPYGAFAFKDFERWPTGEFRRGSESDSKDPEEHLCSADDALEIGAFAIPRADMIVFCEAELVNAQALLGQNQQAANARIKAGDALPDAMSTTWLHELIHIWTVSPPVPDQRVARQDETGAIIRNFKDSAYGFDECANLAKLVPDDAKENAENYALFATVRSGSKGAGELEADSDCKAVWLDGWDWATAAQPGKAVA